MTKKMQEEAETLLEQLKDAYSKARDLLVNCWHLNEVESEALWQIYCPSGTAGIAIRTDIDALWSLAENEPGGVVGAVNHVDYNRAFSHGDKRIFNKRASFKHEQEVRVVLPNKHGAGGNGKDVACNLQSLVKSVVLSPNAPTWYQSLVEELCKTYGFEFDICRSEIEGKPFY